MRLQFRRLLALLAGVSFVLLASSARAAARAPKIVSFSINRGATATMERQVTLDTNVAGTGLRFQVSEGKTFAKARWRKFPSFDLVVLNPNILGSDPKLYIATTACSNLGPIYSAAWDFAM